MKMYMLMTYFQLYSKHENNITELKNPVYHDLNTDNLFSLNVELHDLNREAIKFTSGGCIVATLGLEQ